MKIKETSRGTYTIKGLELDHLEVLRALLDHVVLGPTGYPGKAADIAIELERFGVTCRCEPYITIEVN